MIARKESKKKLILPVFIGLIMILSVIGFSLTYNNDNSAINLDSAVTYNNRQYTRTSEGWAVKLADGYAAFSYHPGELESINIPNFNLANKVYLAYDPDNKDQNIDFIIQKLNNILLYNNVRPVKACTKDTSSCPNLPIIDCNSDKAIVIMQEEELNIEKQNSCLTISGSTSDINKATDKLAMQWLGLI